MAYLRTKTNRVGKQYYYSIVKSVKWEKNMRIPLDADTLEEAEIKHQEVEDNEKGLKRGQRYVWSWENGNGNKTRIVRQTIYQIIEKWLDIKKTNVSFETHRRYVISLNCFMNITGKSSPIASISNQTIEDFKKFYKVHHSPHGINVNLRGIKAFLRWSYDEGHLKTLPKIVMMKTPQSKPKYIREKDFQLIMESDSISDWYKDAFRLYHSTGMRRSEVINGHLEGSFLIVSAEYSKTRRELEIPLEKWMISVVREIHKARDKHIEQRRNLLTFKDKFTKAFNVACKDIGIYLEGQTNLHCLRHTFAVRRYLQTRDLYQVCKELNHTSITTTEIYSQFSFKRLEQDFPSLAGNGAKKCDLDTQKVGTPTYIGYNPHVLN